jgi:hypothetical protein
MWKYAISLLLAIVATAFAVQAQSGDTTYNKEWLDIDSTITISRLPKSALEKVNLLYQKSVRDNLGAQQLKCLLYQMTLEQQLNEPTSEAAIKRLKKEISFQKDPLTAMILHAMLSVQYHRFYKKNRWAIDQRKPTRLPLSADINLWNSGDFNKAIAQSYGKALSQPELLKKMPVSAINALIQRGNGLLQPTNWYELILLEKLSYDKDPIVSAYVAASFSTWQSLAFLEPDSFNKTILPSRDSSAEMQVLRDYQSLIAAQSNKKEPQLSIALHIDRLEWAWQQTGSSPSRQDEYKKGLQQIIQSYPDNPSTLRAYYALATIEINNERNRYKVKPGKNGLLSADSLLSVALQKKVIQTPETIAIQNLLAEIRRQSIEATMEAIYLPGEPLLSLIEYQNTPRVFVRVVALNSDEWEKYNTQKKPSEAALIAKKSLQEKFWNLPGERDLRKHTTEIYLDPLPAGQYLLITATQKELDDNAATISLTPFQVSSIATVQQGNHWIALHRTTGKPLPKVAFQFYSSYSSSDGTGFRKINNAKGISDSLGQFYFNYTSEYANGLSIKYQQEELLLLGKIFSGTDETNRIKNIREGKKESRVQIFTDRKIFRPGQTVLWKAIGSVKDSLSAAPALLPEGTKLKFYLKDAQGNIIDSVDKSLNSFGSCHGKFELPKDRLTGNFSIVSSASRYQQATILVEEYKRPRFTVAWEDPKQGYSLLDSIQMMGYTRSFAGNILQNAKVKYTINRSLRYEMRGSRMGSLEIGSGITQTDQEGRFRLKFSPLTEEEKGKDDLGPFNFEIIADVTDASGESRTARNIIFAGSQSVFLEWQIKEVMGEKDWKKIRLFTGNLSGEKISSPVRVSLFALQTPKKTLRKKYWEAPDQVILSESIFREKFPLDEYGDELNPANWQRLRIVSSDSFITQKNGILGLSEQIPEPGFYRLVTTTRDPVSGKIIESVAHFQIIHESGDKNQIFSNPTWYQNDHTIQVGDFMEARLSIAESEAHLLISKIDPNNATIGMYSQPLISKEFNYKEKTKQAGRFYYHVAFIQNNRSYSHSFGWEVQPANQQLSISSSSFRNPLEPGSQEKWTIEIKDQNGGKVAGELMSTLYDASLEALSPHSWNWNSFGIPDIGFYPLNFLHNFSRTGSFSYYTPEIGNSTFPVVQPNRFARSAYELINQNRERKVEGKSYLLPIYDEIIEEALYEKVYASPVNIKVSGKVNDAVAYVAPQENDAELSKKPNLPSAQRLDITPVRKQLQETAFFLPEVYADSSGSFTINFTLPESLTRWKWMNFAHTRSLQTGFYITEIETRKQLMVIPQMPRFLREGDQIELITQIANSGDSELTGQVVLELINAATEKPVDGWFNHVFPVQYFTVASGKTSIIKFPIQIPYGFNQPLIWRIKAKSGNLSDGEQNILPVITNRTQVTESRSFWLQGDTVNNISLSNLLKNTSPTLSHQNIQWEIATRPAWYVAKALPYLIENDQPSAEQVWNRIYGNLLAGFTLHQYPYIQSTLQQWRQDSTNTKNRFEKAAQISSTLNRETPWLKEAATEEQQLESLSRLLDKNQMGSEVTTLLPSLQKFQNSSGGFSWLEGGIPDEVTTLYIAAGMKKLKELNAVDVSLLNKWQPMLSSALRYLDSSLHIFYDRSLSKKELTTRYTLPDHWIHYLQIRSHFNDIPNRYPSDFEYIRQLASRNWRYYGPLQQSQLAELMMHGKEKDTALQRLIPSLLETAVQDTVVGMYWKYSGYRGGYTTRLSMASQMLTILKRAGTLSNNTYQNHIESIIRWMLQQKRTSQWETTPATAEACNALLSTLPPAYLNHNKEVEVKMGNMSYRVSKEQAEAGTGYFRQVVEGKKIDISMGNITVRVSSDNKPTNQGATSGPVSGAVYWQYLENLDRIKGSQHPDWSIQKKLFLSRNSSTGNILEPLSSLSTLKKGDRIVTRLIITCQRPMEFVYLKDMRATGSEPEDVISEFKQQDRLSYYQTTLDTHTGFFFRRIEKGIYIIDYSSFLTHPGEFSFGIARLQSLYAPEFQAHSSATTLRVGD